jgi:hypothetical protein
MLMMKSMEMQDELGVLLQDQAKVGMRGEKGQKEAKERG